MPFLETGSHKWGFLSYTVNFYSFTYSYCKIIYENEFPLLTTCVFAVRIPLRYVFRAMLFQQHRLITRMSWMQTGELEHGIFQHANL